MKIQFSKKLTLKFHINIYTTCIYIYLYRVREREREEEPTSRNEKKCIKMKIGNPVRRHTFRKHDIKSSPLKNKIKI